MKNQPSVNEEKKDNSILIIIVSVIIFAIIFTAITKIPYKNDPSTIPIKNQDSANVVNNINEMRQQLYIIEISCEGDPYYTSVAYSGSIGGGGNSRTEEGVVFRESPVTYNVNGWPAVAVMQKRDKYGTLTVSIKDSNGKVINTQTTTAAYGVVSVSSG